MELPIGRRREPALAVGIEPVLGCIGRCGGALWHAPDYNQNPVPVAVAARARGSSKYKRARAHGMSRRAW